MARSLRKQLLAWVLFPLAFAAALDAWLTYESAQSTASVVQDRLLLGAARMIAEQIRFEDGAFQGPIPPAALELFQSEGVDRIYYRVSSGDGKLLSGYSDLPAVHSPAAVLSPTFSNALMRGHPVRMVALPQPVVGSPSSAPAWVQMAQTGNERQRLVDSLWRHQLGWHAIILLLTAALIAWGTHRGTRSLLKLRDEIAGHREGSLKKLETQAIPQEVLPLVEALNDYVERIESGISQRNSQLQNVAHQLRTPLTVLATHISDAMRAETAAQSGEALTHARKTLSQTNKTVHQFLQLSAAESFVVQRQSVDVAILKGVLAEVLEGMALFAHQKDIDLGLEVHSGDVVVQSDLVAIREMCLNLLDNAIRYTPVGGIVTLSLVCKSQAIELRVEDTGPGVPVADREKIFERFVRLNPSGPDGSGLGLAIVRELVAQCGAQLRIDEPSHGANGFSIVVVLR
jgi:two-component system sensor histidine kinase TctE